MPKTKSTPASTQTTKSFALTIPENKIKIAYQQALKDAAKTMTIKGFRPGKAPLKIVEQNLDQTKLYERVFSLVFSPAYSQAIKTKQLKPITSPKVTVKKAKDTGDWEFLVEIAERPIIKLGQYQTAIKSAFAKDKIWTPKKEATSTKPKTDETFNRIVEVLLKTCSTDISDILIEEEVNRRLSQLLSQIDKLGLTLDQYANSLNKSVETIKQEYQESSQASLAIEFIIEAIADEQNLHLTESEYTDFLGKITNTQTKTDIQQNRQAQLSIRYSLTKKKVIDYLVSLTN